MPLLLGKRNTDKNGYKLVGAYLPSRIHSYLTLYCIAKNTSRTTIMREMLEAWVCREKKNYTEDALFYEIAQKINYSWKVEKASGRKPDYKEFLKGITDELLNKGLDEKTIQKIFTEVRS